MSLLVLLNKRKYLIRHSVYVVLHSFAFLKSKTQTTPEFISIFHFKPPTTDRQLCLLCLTLLTMESLDFGADMLISTSPTELMTGMSAPTPSQLHLDGNSYYFILGLMKNALAEQDSENKGN